jgi:regulator of protease activity HflC (stomatin/prohibitin superfamily)
LTRPWQRPESHKIRAKAEAESEDDAILTRARAEAEAIELRAAAEAERAEVLSRTALGQQEALLSQYKDMVIQSNSGVEKVIYLDPSVNRDSPFALGSLQNLNNDLHSLTRIGVAAGMNGHNGGSNSAKN